jgi:hypothetical protein
MLDPQREQNADPAALAAPHWTQYAETGCAEMGAAAVCGAGIADPQLEQNAEPLGLGAPHCMQKDGAG